MKNFRFFAPTKFIGIILCFSALYLIGCDDNNSEFEEEFNSDSKISAPTFDKDLTTTDTDGFSIRLRFTNGGDSQENMDCWVYWNAYSSKPSSTPSKGSLTNSDYMRVYNHTKTKTTFDQSHAGYKGGTYIYYYAECSNSKGSCTTDISYTIVKR